MVEAAVWAALEAPEAFLLRVETVVRAATAKTVPAIRAGRVTEEKVVRQGAAATVAQAVAAAPAALPVRADRFI
jgi:hypothetical protein